MTDLRQAKTAHSSALRTSETALNGIKNGLQFSNNDEKIQQITDIIEKSLKCPAQDKSTLMCYSKAWFEAKAGKAKVCQRPCEYERQIREWNEKHAIA